MKTIIRLVKTILDSIPRVMFLNKKSYISTNRILKGYKHANSFNKNYRPQREDDIMPWMTYPFLDYIKNLDLHDKTIFEYGSGYSTVFWAKNAKSIVSVENDERWYQKVKEMVPINTKLLLRNSKEAFISSVNENNDNYDIIILDGYGFRYECAQDSIEKLNEGGMIILDDADNLYYKRICDFLKGRDLIQIDCIGLKPFSCNILSTSIFIRRNFNFRQKYAEVQPKMFIGDQRNYIA